MDAPNTEWEQDAVIVGVDDISDFNEDNILPHSPEDILKIRQWLQPTPYDDSDSEYKRHLSSHLAGTSTWLFSSPTYEEWQSSQEMGILWIRGVPGSGKSVLAATLVNTLSHDKVPTLYFFFRQIIDANHTPLAAIRDWLCQILTFSPPLQAALLESVTTSRSLESVSAADLWRLLRMSISYLSKVYCVVDALDEINQGPEMISFLHSLADLGKYSPGKVKLILTSRPVHSVEIHLRQVKLLNIRLDEIKVDVDIATYVQHQLTISSIPSEYYPAIKDAVPGRANGLFLYARLAMDAFLEPGANLEQVLHELPTDLNVMYTDLLKEHCKRTGIPPNVQLLILQWVTHATRPLRLLELAESINVTHYTKDQRNLKAAKDLARSACGPLVEILPDETLSVIHHSLTEFLNGSTRTATDGDYPILEYGPTHNYLALVCLAHLQSGCLDNVVFTRYPRADGVQLARYHILPPFAYYATMNWYVHARKAASAGVDQTEVNAVLDDLWRGERFQTWSALARVGCRKVTPLFAAVSLGLTQYTQTLLLRPDTNPNKGEMKIPPLYCAAEKGYDDIVGLLLQHGADFNEGNPDGYRPLHAAAENNQPGAVTLLLRAGADPYSPPGKAEGFYDHGLQPKGTPISKACNYGHVEAVSAMLPSIHTSGDVHEALEAAVSWKRSAVVRVLLGHPQVQVDAMRKKHTLLYSACANRDPKTIKLLLDAGADPNIVYDGPIRADPFVDPSRDPKSFAHAKSQTERGYTALFALSSGGDVCVGGGLWSYRINVMFDRSDTESCIEGFKLLLNAGANVNQLDSKGNTALNYAYDVIALRTLLRAGTNPTISNDAGETLLHGHTNVDILRLVLEETNLDINFRTKNDGNTPLLKTLTQTCSGSATADKALLLLEFGANASAVDLKGNSVFHLAAATRFPSTGDIGGRIIRALQASGGDGYFANNAGDTPLHTMDYGQFSEETFNALVDAGCDTEARDHRGRTPLLKAVSVLHDKYECKKVFDAMVKVGCKFDALDDRGRNLLFLVTFSDRSQLFPHLAALGVNPKQTDYDGNTLWHVAVLCRMHFHLREDLIDLGVDPERPNFRGRTPLHIICSRRTSTFDDHNVWNSTQLGGPTTFDRFLTLVHNLNDADEDGVTALHITSTFSEYQTRKLLQAGADWMKITREGSTVFHIAAKSRQANIIGIIMDFITLKGDKNAIPTLINERDILGRTSLWYACASGRIETVKMLISAGAMVETDSYEGSPWEGCVEFEKEQTLWASMIPEGTWDHDYSSPYAGGTLISDKTRPNIREKGKRTAASKHRIDEIVEILATYQSNTRELLPSALSSAAEKGFVYSVDCLIRASESLPAVKATNSPGPSSQIESPLLESMTLESLEKRRTTRAEASRVLDGDHDLSRFERLLRLREYQLAGQVLLKTDCLRIDHFGETVLHRLVRHGYASVLARVCSHEMATTLEDFTWCEQQEKSCKAIMGSIQPLLLDAVLSDLPNMDIVRVLVEHTCVDVNGQSRYRNYTRKAPPLDYEYLKDEGVLHRILKSFTWWQASQALPYIVEKGAHLELRDRLGKTPLHIALERASLIVYDFQAVKLLVSLGADVNAIDHDGVSCLGRCLENIATVEFLIQKGARVTYADLLKAIEKSQCAALEYLLEKGGDPNGRAFSEQEWTSPTNPKHKSHRKSGSIYLLEHAGCECRPGVRIDRKKREEMVMLLVRYGADVNALYEDTTLMHRLICSSDVVRLLLKHPFLNVNLVDPDGRTILHTACSVERKKENSLEGDLSYVEILLDRGADIFARDLQGKNALHYLFQATGRRRAYPDPRAVAAVLKRAPKLVAEVDDEENTPLHKACWASLDHVGDLLSLAADPLAVNGNGATPLHYLVCDTWNAHLGAKIAGLRYDLFQQFLAIGANINARDHRGETPIFHYFRKTVSVYYEPMADVPKTSGLSYHSPVWEKLLYDVFDNAGVDWGVINNNGETLMHVVAGGYGRPMIGTGVQRFKFLMEKGLDVMAENTRQQTPLDLAAALDEKEILALLK